LTIELQIIAAVVLDLLIGDPRWFPHPVRFIGRFALTVESPCRRLVTNPRFAGIAAAIIVVGGTILATWAVLAACRWVHPFIGDLAGIFIIYTGIAARDLVKHSTDVYRSLIEGDLQEARRRVGMICGRDTDRLDQQGVVRSTVESVAENMVDGVTAPIFFAAIGGPIGIMAYKAVSTLDSTFGYKNEHYREFGWASARLDDVAAFIPSRLTAVLVPLAAFVLGQNAIQSLSVFFRDRAKHPSPNAGQSEAAVAGALNLQLGGLSYYRGKPSNKPTLGDPLTPPAPCHIREANMLMLTTSFLALVACVVTMWLV
jgi:adenosylcobinamide-phosphate synthase